MIEPAYISQIVKAATDFDNLILTSFVFHIVFGKFSFLCIPAFCSTPKATIAAECRERGDGGH